MKLILIIMAVFSGLPVKACSIAIVFAVDISQSVSRSDFEYQRNGLARALLDPNVQSLIRLNDGGILATVMVWSGEDQQRQEVEWSALYSTESIAAFSRKILEMRRPYRYSLTAIANALKFAGGLFSQQMVPCQKQVIDISGDGVTSVFDQHPDDIVEELVARGLVINALVISGSTPDPVRYYGTRVVRGPGSFMIVAGNFKDFEQSMILKLTRELAPAVAGLGRSFSGD